MAAIHTQKDGKRYIRFTDKAKQRRTIWLGKINDRNAERFLARVDELNQSNVHNFPISPETSRWLKTLDVKALDKLSKAGLIPKTSSACLSKFLNDYITSHKVKPATKTKYEQVRDNLVAFFEPNGEPKRLREITEGDADRFRDYLKHDAGLAENTVRRRCGIAKQFFKSAVRHRLISSNPFADIKCSLRENRTRDYTLSETDAHKILEACPDADWRCIFALCRWGGLRCPTEVLALRWSDIDWFWSKDENGNDAGRMLVTSPKTEHHENGANRFVPLFPELRPVLWEAYQLAEDGAEFVVNRYRSTDQNMRTTFTKIIKRAGLTPWPKLFHNLRATRETELVERQPLHVVCKWLGNSPIVAQKHYLQVTDEHFISGATSKANPLLPNSSQKRKETSGNSSQAIHEAGSIKGKEASNCDGLPKDAGGGSEKKKQSMGDTGPEPVFAFAYNALNINDLQRGVVAGTESTATQPPKLPISLDLEAARSEIAAAIPDLNEHQIQAVLAIVRGGGNG